MDILNLFLILVSLYICSRALFHSQVWQKLNSYPIPFLTRRQATRKLWISWIRPRMQMSQYNCSKTSLFWIIFCWRHINYLDQRISLYDPYNCLSRRLLIFNLSGSPFLAAFHQNYTFLNCTTQVTKSRFTTIDCLSNSTNSVLAISSKSLVNSVASSCQIITPLPISVSWLAQYDGAFSADVGDDIQLKWYTPPQCGDCEAECGICGFKSNSGEEIDRFHLPKSGKDLSCRIRL
ncbi:putative RING-H2 finger protein ATL21A [Durio zibethinus]|uniref:RING-type E3 ubiquitin transferase n=1 Tax=Durio zibethinus TaxID=66656 RepID=A0A6P6B0B2_DURZI|nr:putative RING-H2 finger protein ATL21A [Durio zibethinus]